MRNIDHGSDEAFDAPSLLTPASTTPIVGLSGETLIEFQPVKAVTQKRRIYVTQDVHLLLRTPNTALMFPSVEAERVLTNFYAGYGVSVSLASAKDCQFERLEGVGEIWAACFRKPRPGWRLFGWFVEPDVLMLGAGYDRRALAGQNYSKLATQTQTDLLTRFPNLPVLVGNVAEDYIKGLIWNLDEA